MGLQTPLYKEHLALGARMVDFAGWDLPVLYSSPIDEHEKTRSNAGLFDISHMGEFIVKGKQAKPLLQHLLTNDLDRLPVGKAFYSALCKSDGGILDDLFVYCFSPETYMLVVNASNIEKNWDWIVLHGQKFDVQLKNISDEMTKIDLQGPKSEEILKKCCSEEFPSRFQFKEVKIDGIDVILSRTGYTGEDGFELYYHRDSAAHLWRMILDAGKQDGLIPAGLAARDSLRLESCYSLYGHELSEEIDPFEAGIGFVVRLEKEFIGHEALAKKQAEGPKRMTVAYEALEKAVPRQGYPLFSGDDRIGETTSGGFAPTLRKYVGMALVRSDCAGVGREIQLEVRGKRYKAVTVKRPFREYQGGTST